MYASGLEGSDGLGFQGSRYRALGFTAATLGALYAVACTLYSHSSACHLSSICATFVDYIRSWPVSKPGAKNAGREVLKQGSKE